MPGRRINYRNSKGGSIQLNWIVAKKEANWNINIKNIPNHHCGHRCGYTGWHANIAGSGNLFYLFMFSFLIILQLVTDQEMVEYKYKWTTILKIFLEVKRQKQSTSGKVGNDPIIIKFVGKVVQDKDLNHHFFSFCWGLECMVNVVTSNIRMHHKLKIRNRTK